MSFLPDTLNSIGQGMQHDVLGGVSAIKSTSATTSLTSNPAPVGGTEPSNVPGMGLD